MESDDERWQTVSPCNNEYKWMMNGWNEWDSTKRKMKGSKKITTPEGMKRTEEQQDGCKKKL